MRRKLLYCIFLFFSYSMAPAQNSAVKIKVKDEDILNLPGASVVPMPGKYRGVTNQGGDVLLSAVPPGNYTLVVSYIGYQAREKSISVNNGTTELTEILTSNPVLNKEAVVMGNRPKGQSKALNQQKNSGNITNIISADQMGRFPDANIGDGIKRVPGITMQNDQGEARNIVIRGMGPEFNSVTFNGERIPSTEGDNRRVQMDLIPTDIVQTVEVNKTLTADMDADAIGGSVNFVTRSATNGLRISGTLAGDFNPVRDNCFIGTANFIAGTWFANDRIGFIVNGSYNRNVFGSDNIESVWSKDANGKPFASDHDVRVYNKMRICRSVAATLDFKLTPLHTIFHRPVLTTGGMIKKTVSGCAIVTGEMPMIPILPI